MNFSYKRKAEMWLAFGDKKILFKGSPKAIKKFRKMSDRISLMETQIPVGKKGRKVLILRRITEYSFHVTLEHVVSKRSI